MNTKETISEFRTRGYVVCPNTCFLGPGEKRVYASGPGLPELSTGDVVICEKPGESAWIEIRDNATHAGFMEFSTVGEYFTYCERFGATSEPGLPTFYNAHD